MSHERNYGDRYSRSRNIYSSYGSRDQKGGYYRSSRNEIPPSGSNLPGANTLILPRLEPIPPAYAPPPLPLPIPIPPLSNIPYEDPVTRAASMAGKTYRPNIPRNITTSNNNISRNSESSVKGGKKLDAFELFDLENKKTGYSLYSKASSNFNEAKNRSKSSLRNFHFDDIPIVKEVVTDIFNSYNNPVKNSQNRFRKKKTEFTFRWNKRRRISELKLGPLTISDDMKSEIEKEKRVRMDLINAELIRVHKIKPKKIVKILKDHAHEFGIKLSSKNFGGNYKSKYFVSLDTPDELLNTGRNILNNEIVGPTKPLENSKLDESILGKRKNRDFEVDRNPQPKKKTKWHKGSGITYSGRYNGRSGSYGRN